MIPFTVRVKLALETMGGRSRLGPALLALILTTLLLSACSPSVAASIQGASWLDPHRGLEAFEKYSCDVCHTVATADSATAISLLGLRDRELLTVGVPNTPETLIEFIKDPKSVHPSATMPKLNVTDEEALDIAVYLYNLAEVQAEPGAPSVEISPPSGAPGTLVWVQASNLPPETATRVGVARLGEDFAAAVMALADAEGAVAEEIAIPTSARVGEEWVILVRSMGDEEVEVQSAVFTVTGDRPVRPVVSLSPGFGPPATEVRVEGRSFEANVAVEVGFGNLDSPPVALQTVQTDADGHFAASFQVPESAQPGQAWVATVVTPDSEVSSVTSPDYLVTQAEGEGEPTVYVVQMGDTLGAIARRFGTTVSAILTANPGIGDPDRISVGQSIQLPGAGTPGSEMLLPDLQPLPAGQLSLEVDPETGARQIRYSTTVVNVGNGPLSMLGEYDAETDRTRVTQIIDTADGLSVQRTAGYFVHHPQHGHWHYEDFNAVELWTYREDGSPDEMLVTTGKVTFCISDMTRIDSPPSNAAPEPRFTQCGQSIQGISVGWQDTYGPELPGQQLDITSVPDGRYALRTIVNPDGLLSETDTTNNASIRYVEIQGRTIRAIPSP